MFNNFFFENLAVYKIMWKNIVQPYRTQMTMWRMHIACWIPQTTDTHSEYVILLFHCNSGGTNAPQCYVIVYCLSCYNRSRECLRRGTHRVLIQNTLLFVVFFILGDFPASEVYVPTLRNTVSVPS